MAPNDLVRRYLDAGSSFTNLTQRRAEALVRELVRAGELQADQARDAVADLLERSRRNTDRLVELIAKEVRRQIASLGLVSQADLDRIEHRLASLRGAPKPKKPAAKKATGKKPAAEKPAAKKSTGKKSAAKKSTGKKSAAKKSTGKKPAAKKSTAAKVPATSTAPAQTATATETPVDEA